MQTLLGFGSKNKGSGYMDLSVIIPARNEEFLGLTIDNVLKNAEAETEVIAILDGYWPDPGIPQHPRVTIIHYEESIGQRAATNQGVAVSRAKYVMKLDAHCAVDKGFDVKLMADCEPDWTVIPRMYNLHAFDWRCKKCGHRTYQGPYPKKCDKCDNVTDFEKVIVWEPRWSRKSDSWRFDTSMKFQYWRAYGKRPEGKGNITDTMSNIGACYFMERDRYLAMDGLDEAHGSWGQMGTEISCKSWLSGGRQVCNKKTWYAHMFRTNSNGFSFPYPLSGNQVRRAREHSKKLWLGNTWPKAVHDLDYILERFRPVPDWHDNLDQVLQPANKKQAGKPAPQQSKALVYYTDNTGDPELMQGCRYQLLKCMEDYDFPIISVSQKPLDFGENIVMDIGRSVLSIFRQILAGLEKSTADVIFLIEHDLIYHPSHFDFTPEKKDVFYYDRNRWSVCDETGKAVFYHTNVPSMMCAYRKLLIRHYEKCVKYVAANGWQNRFGYSPPKGIPKDLREGKYKTYMAKFPSLDIRREESWSKKRMDKSQFRSERGCRGWTEADSVEPWGKIRGRFKQFIRQFSER